eukprot:scaffold217437_cov43-Prasinocladus_malaysianus.AAC.1
MESGAESGSSWSGRLLLASLPIMSSKPDAWAWAALSLKVDVGAVGVVGAVDDVDEVSLGVVQLAGDGVLGGDVPVQVDQGALGVGCDVVVALAELGLVLGALGHAGEVAGVLAAERGEGAAGW